MLPEALRLVLAILLFIVAPGILLVQALFPNGRNGVRGAARLALVLGGGMCVLMIVGSVIGLLPHGERGWFRMIAMGGFPVIEVAMLLACALLFWVALQRGAYPSIRRPRSPMQSREAAIIRAKVTYSQGTEQQP